MCKSSISIKTRIETVRNDCTNSRFLIVGKSSISIKTRIETRNTNQCYSSHLQVKVVYPLKQGLKHHECFFTTNWTTPVVKVVYPLKQGLKL